MASEYVDPSVAFLLNCGKEFDLVVLARSTEKALQIIKPWFEMTNVLVVCKEMRSQALVYAKAIDFSVDAANQGFVVCGDALRLVGRIQNATAGGSRAFLEGVREITKKGLASAKEARGRFVDVRQTVEGLLVKMKMEDRQFKIEYHSGSHFIRRPFSEVYGQLTKGIHDLEEFSNILTKFVAWWKELAVEANTQLARQDGMAELKADKFHLQAVERKWKDHRIRYAEYVNEINLVQDRYSLFCGYNVPRSTSPEPWDYRTNTRNEVVMRPEQAAHVDLSSLARSADDALELLTFWTVIMNLSGPLYYEEFKTLASCYMQTIFYSVEVALEGFVSCEEASAQMKCRHKTTKEKMEFLQNLTKERLADAHAVNKEFTDVHIHLKGWIEKMKTELEDSLLVRMKDDLAFCGPFFSDLEQSCDTLMKFANWWEQLVTKLLHEDLSIERHLHRSHLDPSFESTWKYCRSVYEAYINEINVPKNDLYEPSVTTRYSKAPSSLETDYGFYYTRRALNESSESVCSSWSRHDTVRNYRSERTPHSSSISLASLD